MSRDEQLQQGRATRGGGEERRGLKHGGGAARAQASGRRAWIEAQGKTRGSKRKGARCCVRVRGGEGDMISDNDVTDRWHAPREASKARSMRSGTGERLWKLEATRCCRAA